MTTLLALSGRVLVTAVMVCLAGFLGWHLWNYYMDDPWTRDGKVRADVIRLASDVSGIVSDVQAHDNQFVHKGDILFRIDQARFTLALRQAEAQLSSSQAALDIARSDLDLYRKLAETSVTRQKIQQAEATVQQSEAAHQQAVVNRDLAQLNLDRSVVRAPVNGVLTNFSMQPGNYITAGSATSALIDADSYYVAGYFEENKLNRIKVGDRALVYLMGSEAPLKGHVESIAAGIEDRERSDSAAQLANVNPTFSWVRLAQRVPVRIALDGDRPASALVAGRTASVAITR